MESSVWRCSGRTYHMISWPRTTSVMHCWISIPTSTPTNCWSMNIPKQPRVPCWELAWMNDAQERGENVVPSAATSWNSRASVSVSGSSQG